jgi:hypothetical protein
MRGRLILLTFWMLFIPFTFADNVDFYIMKVSPEEVAPGETTTLNITIANLGIDYAAYVYAILDPDSVSPLSVLGAKKIYVTKYAAEGQPTKYFGVILQNERFTVRYRVHVDKDTVFGTYTVPLKLVWRDAYNNVQSENLEFGLKVAGDPEIVIAGVNKTPARIYPDTEFTLVLAFENIGTAKAENVKVELSLPPGITGERVAFLGTLERDRQMAATFSLKAEKVAEAGAKKIGVRLSYTTEEDTQEQLDNEVEVFIYDKEPANLEVAGLDTSPAKLTPGEAFTLSIQLENIGKQDAKAVKVELALPEAFSGGQTSYLGTIKQDDTSTAIFDLEVSPLAEPKSYRLPVKIYYLDEKGELHEEEKEIAITITSPEKRLPLGLLAGIGILLIIALAWWRRRRSAQL